MFGGSSDSHLKDSVASKDHARLSIHANTNKAEELAEGLAKLSSTYPTRGTFKYRANESSPWIETDLWQFVKDGAFNIDPLTLDCKEFENGFEFYYAYEDNKGTSISQSGRIIWK